MDDCSNRLKGLFGRAADLHVEVPASIAAVGNWEVCLFRLIAKTAIVEVRHDADHFDVWLCVGPGPLTDSYTKRAAPAQVSLHKCLVDNRRAWVGLAHRPGVAFIESSAGDDPDPQGCKEFLSDRI